MSISTTRNTKFPTDPSGLALLFQALDADKLLSIGVPEDWLQDVLAADEERFLDLAPHLPTEASEALLEFATTGLLRVRPPVETANPFEHPDALRRFRVVENVEELEQALNYPWEKWIIFLHPSQRETVEREYSGPARGSGSAGTGKTVVALHRTVKLAARGPNRRVLLTTFSDPLASALERKLAILTGKRRRSCRASRLGRSFASLPNSINSPSAMNQQSPRMIW